MSTPRKRPQQLRSQDTYDAILEAAAQLFECDGYLKTTTNGVAERARVSIGSLYQYFPNKDAMLYALGERHLERLVEVLVRESARMRESQPGLEGSVRALVEVVADLHSVEPQMHRLLYDQAPRTAETTERIRRVQSTLAAEVEHHLRRLNAGGPDFAVTALLLTQAVDAQVHGAFLQPPPGVEPAAVLDRIVGLTLGALAA
ncbi:MAG: TetR/AcrR family transcriptional regulator [Solirubrobacteraceae bacterium]|nr:TetR/AcrR family transcriptional regulator [Solirubrobacteraceae bacterium]